VGRHAATQDPLHVLYLGSSADLGALRRLMEAHGVVTRSRLTPAVAVVVADSSVPADHPTVRTAGRLDIPVMTPDEAIVALTGWQRHPKARLPTPPVAPIQPVPAARRSWLFRRSAQ
jgi:hypothetical protein